MRGERVRELSKAEAAQRFRVFPRRRYHRIEREEQPSLRGERVRELRELSMRSRA